MQLAHDPFGLLMLVITPFRSLVRPNVRLPEGLAIPPGEKQMVPRRSFPGPEGVEELSTDSERKL
jgi:hypothetical protein